MIRKIAPVPATSAVRNTSSDAEIAALITSLSAQLRARATDPAFADALVFDGYARISESAEDGRTEKTDRQSVDLLRRMIADGVRLGELLVDDGISAHDKRAVRPAWNRLLDRLNSGAVAGVYCWHIDRLLRQSKDLEKLCDIADIGRSEIRSCSGSYDLTTGDGRCFARIAVAIAGNQSDAAARRIRARNEAKRARFELENKDVFGHPSTNYPMSPAIEAERDAVRFGILAVSAGGPGGSWGAVADKLNAMGVTTRAGLPWDGLKVANMLNTPRHAGLLTLGEGKARKVLGVAVNGTPIVSIEEWNAFTAMLVSRAKGRPAGETQWHLLTGMLKCGGCGGRMNGTTTTGNYPDGSPRRGYRCPVSGCNSVYVDARAIEAVAVAHALDILSDPAHAQMIASYSADVARLEAEIATQRARRRVVTDSFQRGEIEEVDFTASMGIYTRTIASLETKLAEIRERSVGSATALNRAQLDAKWEAATRDQRRELLRWAMPRGCAVLPSAVRKQRATIENTAPRFRRIDA